MFKYAIENLTNGRGNYTASLKQSN